MKVMRMLVCSVGVVACLSGAARADDTADRAAFKQKMHDCATQMKTDHPEMNHDARRQACRKQLGPAPKSAVGAPPAAAPAPASTTP